MLLASAFPAGVRTAAVFKHISPVLQTMQTNIQLIYIQWEFETLKKTSIRISFQHWVLLFVVVIVIIVVIINSYLKLYGVLQARTPSAICLISHSSAHKLIVSINEFSMKMEENRIAKKKTVIESSSKLSRCIRPF